jgi:hypothetical protein
VSWLITQLKCMDEFGFSKSLMLCFCWIFWACDPVCETDLDCELSEELTQCIDGRCESLALDLGNSCNETADCEAEEGVFECVQGHCGQKPQCQQIAGAFSYFIACDGSASAEGLAAITTDGCITSIDFEAVDIGGSPLDFSITLPTIDANFSFAEQDIATASGSLCEQSKWTPSTSSLALLNCAIGTQSSCTIAMVHADRSAQSSCVVDDTEAPLPCEGEMTCHAVLGSSVVGLCQ